MNVNCFMNQFTDYIVLYMNNNPMHIFVWVKNILVKHTYISKGICIYSHILIFGFSIIVVSNTPYLCWSMRLYSCLQIISLSISLVIPFWILQSVTLCNLLLPPSYMGFWFKNSVNLWWPCKIIKFITGVYIWYNVKWSDIHDHSYFSCEAIFLAVV